MDANNSDRLYNEIQAVLLGELANRESVLIRADTPTILRELGLKNYPILFSQSHIRNCLHAKGQNPHWHGLTCEFLCALPEFLEKPVAVYDSLNVEDSVVCVLNAVDNEGLPIIASLRLGSQGQYHFEKLDSNYLTSVYGKNNLETALDRAQDCDFLLYANKKRTLELGNLTKLQLLGGLPQSEFDKIIHQTNNMSN